jgi:hypothetical protein
MLGHIRIFDMPSEDIFEIKDEPLPKPSKKRKRKKRKRAQIKSGLKKSRGRPRKGEETPKACMRPTTKPVVVRRFRGRLKHSQKQAKVDWIAKMKLFSETERKSLYTAIELAALVNVSLPWMKQRLCRIEPETYYPKVFQTPRPGTMRKVAHYSMNYLIERAEFMVPIQQIMVKRRRQKALLAEMNISDPQIAEMDVEL